MVWQSQWNAAHPKATGGGTAADPLSPANMRVLSRQLVGEAAKGKGRVFQVGAPRRTPARWVMRDGQWTPVDKAGNVIPQSSRRTVKIGKPQPNEQVYRSIYQGLVAQLGGSVSPFTNKGAAFYANQVAAIASRAGYAKATPQTVLQVLSGTNKPTAKTTTNGKAPTKTTPTSTTKKPTWQQNQAAIITGRKAESLANTTASQAHDENMTANQAYRRTYSMLSDVPDPARATLARKAVMSRYGKGTKITGGAGSQVPMGQLPKGARFTSTTRQGDGTVVVRLENGTVWKRPPGGTWKQVKGNQPRV
jgi:hypothetical protein